MLFCEAKNRYDMLNIAVNFGSEELFNENYLRIPCTASFQALSVNAFVTRNASVAHNNEA